MKNLVFLSYAYEDLEQVWKIYEGLKKRELEVWFDKAYLGPGIWKTKIKKTIPKCRYFIFCISEGSIKKNSGDKPVFLEDELQIAWEIVRTQPESEFCIVPVRFEDCERGDLRLSSFQEYDLFTDFEKELDKLAVHLGGLPYQMQKQKIKEQETKC